MVGLIECSLSDVTSKVFGNQNGLIAAFGDMNADKATDIFVLSEDGKSLSILEASIDISQDETSFSRKPFIVGKPSDRVIVAVVPGDFNIDSQNDVLVMRKADDDQSSTKVKVEIYLTNQDADANSPYLTINETFRDQPAIIDGNGDMTPDLFGETSDGKRGLWVFKGNSSYGVEYYENPPGYELLPLKVPQSSAFLDLNGDLTADLCAVTESNGETTFEFWLNKDGVLTYSYSVKAPPELKVVGQAVFSDFNGNHNINILLPGCLDEECKDSAVFIWEDDMYKESSSHGSWFRLYVNFATLNRKTTFVKSMEVTSWLSLPITLHIGDFNLDGYPDAMAILSDASFGPHNTSSYLMYNQGCGGDHCGGFSRALSISYSEPLHKSRPVLTSFFDLKENGVLDIVLSEVKSDGSTALRAVEQDFSGDASFLKVMVVSVLCFKSCPHGHTPYGVNQVGPTAKFESTTPMGGDQIGQASQLSQSAYFSLQLPFMLFGLGQTPNFVDELWVGIPYPEGRSPRVHSWSSIIPNSQIIIIPYPLDSPSRWKHELYVTPSRLVLLTGVSLLGTCAFIGIIVALLHWRERMEDKKEKLQEAQRFHFDAM
ncbi:T-cell immunomodulatory protein [Plakobranchus ocellatus]|uniref:T-cell immunomodulatory protein n=1 Tax=Plakobranchus ocellatus TaxID=259542 RepID=A0AAV3Z3J0_9GAST|nr:T-cell immunomodulatory protein [Plakobranchus ocellatus]